MGGGQIRASQGSARAARRRQTVLLLVGLLLVLASACRPAQRPSGLKPSTTPTPAATPQPLELLCGDGSGRSCQLSLFATEPDDGVGPLISRLNQASKTIDFAPFLLDEPAIVRALAAAQRRGVQVRMLSEPQHGRDNAKALKALDAAGVQIHDTNPAFGMTHAKFVVIDGSRALQLTFNSDAKELTSRRDFALEDDDPADVQFYSDLFEADWTRSQLKAIPSGFAVSPDNADDRLTALVRSAHDSIDLYAEKLDPSPLLTAIMDAARRGVTVRILADSADRRGKLPGPLHDLVKRQQLQIRVPRDLGIHAKVMLVDGATVYFGSQNVENATAERRRELGLIFADDSIAGRLREAFERDWALPTGPLE
jgi:phosphatidylserine/phosphatidylglycerophosphate/cardiolipin synthase-like enzyme